MKTMNPIHLPKINARYWAGITLASIFGTNTGDWFAFKSGLGILGGLPILGALVALILWLERRDSRQHDAWYWSVIILIRTGATNIADFACGGQFLNLNRTVFCVLLIAFMSVLIGTDRQKSEAGAMPTANGRYWIIMLAAGVFGTAAGDAVLGFFGGPHGDGGIYASISLLSLLGVLLMAGRGTLLNRAIYYWMTITVARTAGTAVADMLAEGEWLNIGLIVSTLSTGLAFVLTLVLTRDRRAAIN
jgi:uncharacterized membrane-anchored protein